MHLLIFHLNLDKISLSWFLPLFESTSFKFYIPSISHTSLTASAWPSLKSSPRGDLIFIEINLMDEKTSWLEILRNPSQLWAIFYLCGNPTKFSLIDGPVWLIFSHSLPLLVFWFLKKKSGNFEKRLLYTGARQLHKRKFSLSNLNFKV